MDIVCCFSKQSPHSVKHSIIIKDKNLFKENDSHNLINKIVRWSFHFGWPPCFFDKTMGKNAMTSFTIQLLNL